MDKKIELQQIDMDFLSEMLLKIKVKRSGKELSASDISNLTAEALMEYELYFGVEKITLLKGGSQISGSYKYGAFIAPLSLVPRAYDVLCQLNLG